ncbi:TauD/TfdA family dioxygenase [Pseudomonas sp. TH31]|uniref:TauD/TfdA family dioxygenase n=1 Tax=Pseudomonas sp. TH31 TaxID=2796396 RepID=UPI0019139EC6|nr:TauD/TfdA family dioxygenase [Pseudomonas sp. TH31]MBK5413966.1 TauD/TfdA family dioxygenase [Pseudomonas sp. TH31]
MLLNKMEGRHCWTSKTYDSKESLLKLSDFFVGEWHALLETSDTSFESHDAIRDLAVCITDICESGQGFAVLKGLSTQDYSEEQLLRFYLALSSRIGTLVSQNHKGDKVVSVSNKMSGTLADLNVRAYNTDQGLSFHSDSSDITGLLCIHNSQEGGDSLVVSAGNIHNLILAEHKEFLSLFYHGFLYDNRGEENLGLPPAYRNSVFYHKDNKLSCRFYLSDYVLPGLEKMRLKPSKAELDALALFTRLCEDPANYVSFKMEPGDIVFYDNNATLHARTPFVSSPNVATNRLLHRVWINPHEHRVFPEGFAKYRFGYNDQI